MLYYSNTQVPISIQPRCSKRYRIRQPIYTKKELRNSCSTEGSMMVLLPITFTYEILHKSMRAIHSPKWVNGNGIVSANITANTFDW